MLSPAPPPFANTGFTPTLTSEYFFNDDPSVSRSPTQTLSLGQAHTGYSQQSPNKSRTSNISSRGDPSPLALNKFDDVNHPTVAYTNEPRQSAILSNRDNTNNKNVKNSQNASDADGDEYFSSTKSQTNSPSLTQPKPVRPAATLTQPPSPTNHHGHHHSDNNNAHHQNQTAPCSPVLLSVPAPIVRPLSGHDGPVEYVGPFVLGPVLGRGCTGTVRLGTHRLNGFEVAFKIIEKKYLNSEPKLWKKVKREIAILKLIEHPHVLKLYDVLETEHRLYLVLEHVKGGELFDYIVSKGRLDRSESLRLTAQIVQGLEHCHLHSICHRDLKPENLLLDEKNNIKIADFGMAQLMKSNSALLKTSCGSPHYASPEIIEGQNYDAKVTDVWSIGVILYALITGSLPFDHDNIPTLLSMVTKGIYSTPAHVPADVSHLIARMLTVDPKKRIRLNEIRHHPAFKGTNHFEPIRGTTWPFNTINNNSNENEKKKKKHSILPSSINDNYYQVQNDSNNNINNHNSNDSDSDDDVDSGQVDENLISDLEALGISSVNNREELKAKVVQKIDSGSDSNLERRFYEILKKRRNSRLSQLSMLSPKVSPRHSAIGTMENNQINSGMNSPLFVRAQTEPPESQFNLKDKPMTINITNESAPSSRAISEARNDRVTPPLQTPEMIGAGEWVNLNNDHRGGKPGVLTDPNNSISSVSTSDSRIPISPFALDDDVCHQTNRHSEYLNPPFSRLQSAPQPMTDEESSGLEQFMAANERSNESAAAFYSRIASVSVPPSPCHSHYSSRPVQSVMSTGADISSAPSSPASGNFLSAISTSAPPASMMAAMEQEQQRRAAIPTHSVNEARGRSSSQDQHGAANSVSRRLFVTEEKSDEPNYSDKETGQHSTQSAADDPHYTTTPRFHRRRLDTSDDVVSPSALLSNIDLGSPVKKKSWFSSIFSGNNPLPLFKNSFRRSSVSKPATQTTKSSSKPITGLYSSKTTLTIADEVRRTLKANGIHYAMKKGSSTGGSRFECQVGGEEEKSFQAEQIPNPRAKKGNWSMRRFSTTAMMENNHHENLTQEPQIQQKSTNPNRRASVGTLLGWTQPINGSSTNDASRGSPPKPPPAPRHKTRPSSPNPANPNNLSRALTAAPQSLTTHQSQRPAPHSRHESINSPIHTGSGGGDHVINIPPMNSASGRARANSVESSDFISSSLSAPSQPLNHVKFIVEITSHHTNDHRCIRFIHVSGDESAFRHWQTQIQQQIHV